MILVVDDNRVTARVIAANLEQAEFEVTCTENARSALEALETSPGIELIITDICMPDLDGFAFIDAIRARPEWADLPVVIASAAVNVDTVKAAQLRDVRRFLIKPIVGEQVVKEAKAAIRSVARPTLYDQQAAIERLGVSEEVYNELIGELTDSIRSAIPKLEAALSKEESPDGEYPYAAVLDEVTSIGETVNSLATGQFMATLEKLAEGERAPSIDDWCRIAFRELKSLLVQLEARTSGGENSEAEAAPEAASSAG